MKITLKSILAIAGLTVVLAACGPKSETSATDEQEPAQTEETAPAETPAEADTTATSDTTAVQ